MIHTLTKVLNLHTFQDNPNNMPKKQNTNDLRRSSDIIDQQPTVNRFMDQKELEWQKEESPKTGKEDKKKDEASKEGKTAEKEDESKYFCCS